MRFEIIIIYYMLLCTLGTLERSTNYQNQNVADFAVTDVFLPSYDAWD